MESVQSEEQVAVENGPGSVGHIRCLSVVPVDLEELLHSLEEQSA